MDTIALESGNATSYELEIEFSTTIRVDTV